MPKQQNQSIDTSKPTASSKELLQKALNGNQVESKSASKKLEREYPNSPESYRWRVMQYINNPSNKNAQSQAQAIQLVLNARKLYPDDCGLQVLHASIFRICKQFKEALKILDHINLNSINASDEVLNIYFEKGSLYRALKRYNDALGQFKHITIQQPQFMQAWFQLGYCYTRLIKLDLAMSAYEKAFALNPSSFDLLINMANLYARLGNAESALKFYRKCNDLSPENNLLKWNISQTLLATCRFKEGWKAYENRWKAPEYAKFASTFTLPQWNGENLQRKTIMLYQEQGIGDQIKFLSLIPKFIKNGAHILVSCDKRLHPIVQRSFNVELVPVDMPQEGQWVKERGNVDYCLPLGSLPYKLDIDEKHQPMKRFFLPKKQDYRTRLQKKFPGKLLIGLAWSGVHKVNPYRTIPFEALAPLTNNKYCQFINLQYDPQNQPKDIPSDTLYHLNELDLWNDLDGVLSLMSGLDLIITSPGANVHLAGSIGKSTLVMMPSAIDWHWPGKGDACLWYPKTILFRRTHREGHGPMIQRINAALNHWINGGHLAPSTGVVG